METLNEKVKRLFGIYPDSKELYATEDGNVFLRRSDCAHHARISNQKMFQYTPEGEVKEKTEDPGGQQDLNAELKKRALEIDPATGDYHEMLKILKSMKKAPASSKKADTIEAFTNLQKELKEQLPPEPAAPAAEAGNE